MDFIPVMSRKPYEICPIACKFRGMCLLHCNLKLNQTDTCLEGHIQEFTNERINYFLRNLVWFMDQYFKRVPRNLNPVFGLWNTLCHLLFIQNKGYSRCNRWKSYIEAKSIACLYLIFICKGNWDMPKLKCLIYWVIPIHLGFYMCLHILYRFCCSPLIVNVFSLSDSADHVTAW